LINKIFEALSQLGSYGLIFFEIGLLTLLIYSALYFIRGTRSSTILAGLTIVIFLLSLLSRALNLEVLGWITMKMWALLAFSILVIFQPEIRRAFALIGSQQSGLLINKRRREKEMIDLLIESTCYLADRRIGALIAVEQNIGTRAYAETGIYIHAPLSSQLLSSIFFPNTPLHDGGVIIKNGEILAAGCIFPLTQSPDMNKSLGTRHRAGVGISEETDAIILIVSEESGSVSLAHKGRLVRGVTKERLKRHLTNFLVKKEFEKRQSPMMTVVNFSMDNQHNIPEDEV